MEKRSVSRGWSTSTQETNHGEGTHPVVPFGPEDKANFCKEHELSLFAKVLGKTVGHMRLHTHLNWLWGLAETLVVVALENDFFLLKFPNRSAYQKALDGVPWLIHGHYITLHPWFQNFKPSEAIITKVVVWIRLPELPIEYYAQVALTRIAERIGKLFKIDLVTQRKSVCKFARLCVEIDITVPLTTHIELDDGLLQTIIYEGHHVVCDHCWRFGHLHLSCPDLLPIGTEPTYQAWTTTYPSANNSAPSYSPGPPGQGQQQQTQAPYHQPSITTPRYPSPSYNAPSYGPVIISSMSEQLGDLQLGEGTFSSSHGKNRVTTATTTETTDVTLDSTQLPEIEESTSRLFVAAMVLPDFYSSEPRQGNKANPRPPPLSSTFPPSSSISNNTPPPSPPAHLVTSTKPTDSPNQPPLIPRQSSTSTWEIDDQFYLHVVPSFTQKLEINTERYLFTDKSTHGWPRVFTIESKISEMAIRVNILPLSTGIANQHHISIDPTTIDHTTYLVRPSCKKKLIIWNCGKAGEPKVVQAMKDLFEQYQPSIILLFVTRIYGTDADNAIRHLGFSCSYIDPTKDCTSGVWLLWREEEVNIKLSSTASHRIHAAVEFLPKGHDLIFHGADAADEKQLDCSAVFGVDSDEDSVS